MSPRTSSSFVLCLGLLLAVLGGCHHPASEAKPVGGPPAVQVVHPVRRMLAVTVEQAGFVNALEQTSIFSKVSGFIKNYYVDIGANVTKGQLLAEIFVPELKEKREQMLKQVELDKQLIVVGQKSVENAVAEVAEAKANVGKYEADITRWKSEVQRLQRMVDERVVDMDILTETQQQLASSVAAKKAAEATVNAREADRLMAEANLLKARIQVKVAEAEERMSKAMLDYTEIRAPYDGVVTARNANRGDYVQAVSGDKSSTNPSALFVVEQVEQLRVFFDVPEQFAAYVVPGKTKAAIRADALSGIEIPATVTRCSWAIRERTRTLWTEIDLAKKDYNGLRPGMYVYVNMSVERPDVFTLPKDALLVQGNQTYCFLVHNGKALKTSVDAGIGNGQWTEVHKMRIDGAWVNVTGNEMVIVGDLTDISDGEAVKPITADARKP